MEHQGTQKTAALKQVKHRAAVWAEQSALENWKVELFCKGQNGLLSAKREWRRCLMLRGRLDTSGQQQQRVGEDVLKWSDSNWFLCAQSETSGSALFPHFIKGVLYVRTETCKVLLPPVHFCFWLMEVNERNKLTHMTIFPGYCGDGRFE